MKCPSPLRWLAKRSRRLALAYFLGAGLLPAGYAAAHRPAGEPAGAVQAAAFALAATGPWRAHEGVEMASRAVSLAFDPHSVHAADWAACEARWGTELGRLLCPAIFAANEGRGTRQNVELSLLTALWHVSCHRASLAFDDVSRRAARLATYVRPLLMEDPL